MISEESSFINIKVLDQCSCAKKIITEYVNHFFMSIDTVSI